MLEFTKFYHGPVRYYLGLLYLSPMLLFYLAGLIPNWRAKEYFLTYFFRNQEIDDFQRVCDRFGSEIIPGLLRPAAGMQLEEYRRSGDHLVVVSSSIENWLQAWCALEGIDLIATRLRIEDGLLTGQLEGKNCYGPEKVRRLKERIFLNDYSEIIAYGDSKGDFDLFEIASYYFYRPFRE